MSKDSNKNINLLYELKTLDHNDPNIDKILDKISKDNTERVNYLFDGHKYRLRDMAKIYTERMNQMQKLLEKNYKER